MQNTKQIADQNRCAPAEYTKSCYAEMYKVLKSLREDEFFCDVKLETDDGGSIFGHKVVLASASPHFHAIFTNSNQDLVVIKELDSSALRLLINFIYSGKIIITKSNAQVLLPASNLLKLQEVKKACCDFLQAQLCPANVIGINDLADLHSCPKLLKSSELYFQQHFSDVIEGEEFLTLSSEKIVKLISNDELAATSEEKLCKIFKIIIRWVKHDLDSRKQILPKLMEHVSLPSLSNDYILKHAVTESLLNNCSECNDDVNEALHCNRLKLDELITSPHNIRTKPRQDGGTHKVILVVGGRGYNGQVFDCTKWYDPKINKWQSGPKMASPRWGGCLAVVKDTFVLYMGGYNSCVNVTRSSVYELDLSLELPNWKPTTNMLVKRQNFGVGVINNYIYAVGGFVYGSQFLKCAEVFDCRTQKWRKISSMSTGRGHVGVGVLNNLLYAVGGASFNQSLNSVECYDPGLDKWTLVSELCVRRKSLGVGVLDGVLYAVGGNDGKECLKSVEAYRPSTGVWTTIPDMHFGRNAAGVAVLDGLLYVVGGRDGYSYLDSVESYNPNTNTWTMITASMNVARAFAGVSVIERPRHLKTSQSKKVKEKLIEYIDIYSIYSIIAFCTLLSLFLFYLFSSF